MSDDPAGGGTNTDPPSRAEPFVRTYHVTVATAVRDAEGNVVSTDSDGKPALRQGKILFEPHSWKDAAAGLQARVRELFGERRCVLSQRPIPDERALRPEHVVLQGQGVHWVELPPGTVDDEINHELGRTCETKLQRLGLLAAMRPFYVDAKKRVEFGDAEGHRLVLRNEPEGLVLEYSEGISVEHPTQRGPGVMLFTVPMREPAPLHISRALHKMAYLTLAVCQPEMVVATALDATRRLIVDGGAEHFRPISQQFLGGVPPGFNASFLLIADVESPTTAKVTDVHATIRLHHMLYRLTLAGAFPQELRGGPAAQYFEEPGEEGVRPVTLGFGFEDVTGPGLPPRE